MKSYTNDEEKYLLNLARESISHYLSRGRLLKPEEPPYDDLKEKAATFVTLTKDGRLRGCIGNLYPENPLYLDVVSNAVAAAFSDPRFPALSEDELEKIKIEVSILSDLKPVYYDTPEDLLEKLDTKYGVLLKKGHMQSTFLPQVWKQIPDKKLFMESLCMKAGLSRNAWHREIRIFFYEVHSFEEE